MEKYMNSPFSSDLILSYLDAEEDIYASKVGKEQNKAIRTHYIYILFAIRECKKCLTENKEMPPFEVLDVLAQMYYEMGLDAKDGIPKQRLATIADTIDDIAVNINYGDIYSFKVGKEGD